MLDCAEVCHREGVRRTLEKAEQARIIDWATLRATCLRMHGRHGLKHLLPLLAPEFAPPDTRSGLEREFFDLCQRHSLALPVMNVIVAGVLVDAAWPGSDAIVELDGFEWHRTRAAFEEDRRRDAALIRAGYRIMRITARRLREEPERVAAELRAHLNFGGS